MKIQPKIRQCLSLLTAVVLLGLLYVIGPIHSSALDQGDPNAVAPAGTYSDVVFPEKGMTAISNETTINNVPNLGSVGYFWSHSFGFTSPPPNGGAYIGIQGINKAVFSVFNHPSPEVSPTCDVQTQGFDGGAYSFGGTSCHIEFTITQGKTYKLSVTKVDTNAHGNRWVGVVEEVGSGRSTAIGTINVPTSWGDISNTSGGWTEYFPANVTPIGECTKIPISDVTFSNFSGTKNGANVSISSHSNHINQNKCKEYSSVTDINNNSFNQKMGIKNDNPSPTPSSPAPGGGGGGGSGSGGSGYGPGGNDGVPSNVKYAPGPDKAAVDAAKAKVTVKERNDATHCNGPADCISKNAIIKQMGMIFDILSAIIALAIIGTIIVGGITYSASGGDPNTVAKAKKMIGNAVLAFVAYFFLYAFLQWLVPGGLF